MNNYTCTQIGGVVAPKQKKWKDRVEEKTHHWTSHKPDTVISKENVSKATNAYQQMSQHQSAPSGNHKLDQKIGGKQKDIWNAMSDFNADKTIDYKLFSDNLRDRGINVSPLLAQQLFGIALHSLFYIDCSSFIHSLCL